MNDEGLDPEQARAQRREEKAAKQRIAVEDAAVQSLMATTGGRAWMLSQLEFCTVFHTTFTGKALASAFNEGRRTVGLRLLDYIMRACPEAYIQMMKEQNDGGRSEPEPADDEPDPTEWGAIDGSQR